MNKSFFVLLFLLTQILLYAEVSLANSNIVAYVNKEAISKDEFVFFAQRNKSKIISWYRNEYNLNYHSAFWDDKSKGKSPSEVLKQITLDTIISIKVQFLLAKKYGIIDEIGFNTIQASLAAENKKRRDAMAKKTVFYGPEQYELENYYDYLFSNMVIKLKDYLVRNEFIVVEKFKETTISLHNKKRKKEKKMPSEVYVVSVQINAKYNELISKLIHKAKIKINKGQIDELRFGEAY